MLPCSLLYIGVFMNRIKTFLKNKYDSSGTVAKSVFNSIVRTMVSFGLVCVAALYMYYIFFAEEDPNDVAARNMMKLSAEMLQKGYELNPDENSKYNPSLYNLENPTYIGNISNGSTATIEDYINENYSGDEADKFRANIESMKAHVGPDGMARIYMVDGPNGKSLCSINQQLIDEYNSVLTVSGGEYKNFEELRQAYINGEIKDDAVFTNIYKSLYENIIGDCAFQAFELVENGKIISDVDMPLLKAFYSLAFNPDYEIDAEKVNGRGNMVIQNLNDENYVENDPDVVESGGEKYRYEAEEEDVVTNIKANFEDLLKKYVTTEIFTGVGYATAHPIWAMLNSLFEEFMSFLKTEFWNPNVYELSSINIGSGTVGFFNFYFSLMNMFKVIGAVIVVFLFLFGLFLSMFSTKLSNIKDTPLQLVARLGISLFLITLTTKICDWFVGIIGELWGTYLDSTPLNQDGTFNIVDLFCIGVPASASAATEWEANGSFLRNFWTSAIMINPALHTCAMLIGLLIMWPILKQFLALAVEIIERALVLLIIYALAPLAYASLASSATSNIFKNYIKMLMAQLVILASNNLFVAGFCYLVSKGVQKANLCGYVFTLSYLRTAQRFDSYLRTLGLSATQTGGQVIESIGMAAHNLSRTVRQGNEMRKGAGTLVEAAGVAAGSTGLVKAGKALGMSTASMSQAMNSGGGGVLGTVNALADIGRRGNSTKANNGTVENVLAGVSKNPTDTMQYAARGINEKSYTNFAQSKGLDVEKFDKVNFSHANNGVISMSGIDKAGNAVKYEISNDASAAKDHSKVVDLKDGKGNVTGYMYEV